MISKVIISTSLIMKFIEYIFYNGWPETKDVAGKILPKISKLKCFPGLMAVGEWFDPFDGAKPRL